MGEADGWIEVAVEKVLNDGWRTAGIADVSTPAGHILGTGAMGEHVVEAPRSVAS